VIIVRHINKEILKPLPFLRESKAKIVLSDVVINKKRRINHESKKRTNTCNTTVEGMNHYITKERRRYLKKCAIYT